MRKWLFGGRGRREGAMDGLNLFFGALLGANLGTLDGLKLVTYVQLVTVLAGTVIALRLLSTAERRAPVFVLLGLYLLLLLGMIKVPQMRPQGMAPDDLNRLVATLFVWLAFSAIIGIASRRFEREPG